ncbi:MAG: hypothetical protein A2X94_13605 [Bdellovibrionales bacterium GWB1_55_8]|nr:MAG: hypothetical protein A2X94_13605 [Bdellovibrionales bacterium GWB1_55_8]
MDMINVIFTLTLVFLVSTFLSVIVRIDRESTLGSFEFTYDPLDQVLASAFSPAQGVNLGPLVDRTWTYDVGGSRLTDSLLTGSAQVIANALVADSAYDYWRDPDGLGQVAQKRSKSSTMADVIGYRVDGKNTRFLRFDDQNQNGVLDGTETATVEATYYYDALGRRIAKRILQNGSPTFTQSHVHWLDQDKILLGKAGDDELTVYLDGDGPDEHYAQIRQSGDKLMYVTDHLGSVLNGEYAKEKRTMGVFGEYLGTNAVPLSSSTEPVTYGFTGRQYDAESGQYYYRARMYDPGTGRFLTKDPIGFEGGDTNLYRYVGNSPLSYVDPFGLAPGDMYSTPQAAAEAAGRDYGGVSTSISAEFGGQVYFQSPSGTYSYMPPKIGEPGAGTVNPGPRTSGTVGPYHTHYPGLEYSHTISPMDKGYANVNAVPVYLTTPDGRNMWFDPGSQNVINGLPAGGVCAR